MNNAKYTKEESKARHAAKQEQPRQMEIHLFEWRSTEHLWELAERSIEANKRIEAEGLVDLGSYVHENGRDYELYFHAKRMETEEEMAERLVTAERLRNEAIAFYEQKLKELKGA